VQRAGTLVGPSSGVRPVLDRFVARIPTLLLTGVVVLCALVALSGKGESADLAATAPAAVLLIAYLRAGRGQRGGRAS
jgi:hypothetical protein